MSDPLTPNGLAEAWIYQALASDAALGALVGTQIYAGVAPEGATYPLIAYASTDGLDTTAMAGARVMSTLRYIVHCTDRVGSILALDAIAGRVDAVLHGATHAFASGAQILFCQREGTLALFGQVAGVQTREIALRYVLWAQEVSAV